MLFLLLLLISTHCDSIKDGILYSLRESREGSRRREGGGCRHWQCWALGPGCVDVLPWWGFSLVLFSALPAQDLKAGQSHHAAGCPVTFEIISDRLPKQLVPHFSGFYTSWSLIYKIDHSLQWFPPQIFLSYPRQGAHPKYTKPSFTPTPLSCSIAP